MTNTPLTQQRQREMLQESASYLGGVGQSLPSEVDAHLADTPAHRRIFTKAIQITLPLGTERIMIFRTDKELTCSAIAAVVRGTAPSVTWNVKWAMDLTGLEQAAFTGLGNQTTTSETTGDLLSPDTNPIPAEAWIWLVLASGSADEFAVTLYLEETGN